MKRLLVLGAIAILPLFAQVSSAQTSVEKLAPRQHHPLKDLVEHSDGTATSTNWGGYAVTGTDFTSAEGSWIVPTVTCTSGDQYSAFWVGLDGYSSTTVEQTGTSADCAGKKASYYAWYEFYPAGSVEITSVPVKPGDKITASVTWNSGSSFTTKITDETTGKSYSKTGTVSGAARSSAEWIAEAPCCTAGGGILPLADFGTGEFGLDYTSASGTNYATDSSMTGPISAFSTWEEITIESSKDVVEATPSALSSDGTSFTMTWKAK
ncbi:MAG: G1 family glutamic endopeptidase [Terriglobales bacterium]